MYEMFDKMKKRYREAARSRYGLDLLDKSETHFLCSGCNTLAQLEEFNVQQIAMALAEKCLRHLPNCPLGDD